MSFFDFLRRSSGVRTTTATRPTGRKGNDTAASPRVTYNCKLCGIASSVRGVVYDHIRHAHSDILDRNGNIHERREDDTRAHA